MSTIRDPSEPLKTIPWSDSDMVTILGMNGKVAAHLFYLSMDGKSIDAVFMPCGKIRTVESLENEYGRRLLLPLRVRKSRAMNLEPIFILRAR